MRDDLDATFRYGDDTDERFFAAVARCALAFKECRKLLDKLELLVTATIVIVALSLGGIAATIETVTMGLGNLPRVITAVAALMIASFARLVADRPE